MHFTVCAQCKIIMTSEFVYIKLAFGTLLLTKGSSSTYSVLERYIPSPTLRSSDTNLLSVPCVRTCFGSRSFSVAAPTIWNSLPFDIRNSCLIAFFRRKLKTFYF